MNRRDILRQTICLLVADRVAGNTLAVASLNDRLKPVAKKGRQFLGDMFNPTFGLLPEFRGSNVYWLYHDNYLAAKVLVASHPELARQIHKAIQGHGVTEFGKIEILFGEVKQPLPFRHPELKEVKRVGTKVVKTEIVTDRVFKGWQQYADLLLLAALALAEEDAPEAKHCFRQAMAMWDGKGLKDKVTQAGGKYAAYKLALAIIAAGRLRQHPSPLEAILDRLLFQQNRVGGWITDYTGDGKRVGFANVETTSLALLAIDSMVGQE